MQKNSLAKRFRYWFDNTISKGASALIGLLGISTVLLIAGVSAVAVLTQSAKDGEGHPLSFLQMAWMSLMRTMDAGNMADDSGSILFMVLILIVTIGGIFIVSTLIGILNNGLEQKLDNLRKGRSLVIEKGHTVILGWSPHIGSIISELLTANENQRYSCIAIMADKDKVEMEDEIRAKLGSTGRTRVVCRTGNPMRLDDLAIMNLNNSKSIVVLSPETNDPDIDVIKVILAITNNPKRRTEPYHIVAEIRETKYLEVAKMVGQDEAQLILTGDLISRIAVQTTCQSGLSVIYTELLDFGGDEIYFCREKKLTGKTFAQALLCYEKSALIGIRYRDGRVQLKPDFNTVFEDGDQVIAISEDDNTVRVSKIKDYKINATAIQQAEKKQKDPVRTLLLGWNRWGMTIVNELDNYVTPGSELTLVAELSEEDAESIQNGIWNNQKVSYREGDITDRPTLDALAVQTYHHVMVLSYSDRLDAEEADAQTMITLLHLRDIAAKTGTHPSITTEMLDVRNRELAEIAQVDDFIVSDRLISLMMTQLAENEELMPVFTDLFDSDGSELYLKPAADYIKPGVPVNFYTIIEAARSHNELAIGYRLAKLANKAEEAYGVRINPVKSAMITFSEQDKIVVLAED
jgi:K+ transport systems, NAD-binding component